MRHLPDGESRAAGTAEPNSLNMRHLFALRAPIWDRRRICLKQARAGCETTQRECELIRGCIQNMMVDYFAGGQETRTWAEEDKQAQVQSPRARLSSFGDWDSPTGPDINSLQL